MSKQDDFRKAAQEVAEQIYATVNDKIERELVKLRKKNGFPSDDATFEQIKRDTFKHWLAGETRRRGLDGKD
jgi:hypothetical protein